MNLVDSLNDIIITNICYSFYDNLIWPQNAINDVKYYNYYNNENKLQYCILYLQNFVVEQNISIRHQLKDLTRYADVKSLQHILDYKLNMDPQIVNELITLSMANIDYNDIPRYLEMYDKSNVQKLEYIDKSIVNLFFDLYVYCQLPMCVVVPSYNNINYYEKNLNSIFCQKYKNYRIIYADDQSTDGTYQAVKNYIIDKKMSERCSVYRQNSHNAQCCGRYMCYILIDDDEIVCNVDGDDWMYDRNDSYQYNGFNYIESAYKKGALSTYGCFYKSSGPQWMETTMVYPQSIIENKEYRNYKFLCKHLRTGYAGLYKNIWIKDLLDESFKFLHMCTDISTQYSVLEMAGNRHTNICKPTYIYNQDNSVIYDNSWYNLNIESNKLNKDYNEYVQNKVKNTLPYDSVESIMLDRSYNFNLFREKLDIIILNKNNIDLHKINQKIKHELKNVITYSIKEITDLSFDFLSLSNIVLYINADDNIVVNLNINKYLKYMLCTKIDKVLIAENIECNDSTPITFENNNYIISITSEDFPIEKSSGYYTKDKLIDLFENKHKNDIKLFIKSIETITYIVALYNVPQAWLEVCINSFKNQSTNNYNIIVNDDQTPDLTYKRAVFKYLWNIKNLFFDNKLIISQSYKNLGLAGNNKYMIGLVESPIVACVDPDDAIVQETTLYLAETYKTKPDFVYSNFYYCDKDLNITSTGYSKKLKDNLLVLNENCISHIRSYQKDSYYQTLGYDSTFRAAEDKDIIFKFEECGLTFKFIDKPLYLYRYNS
ncbi:MAG: glycosyltransferase, partial [Rickettsiales bacterium]